MSMNVKAAEVLTAAAQERLPEATLLRPQPGDVIVLRLREPMNDDLAHELSEQLAAQFEGTGVRTIVVGPDADLDVVRKGGD
ncbi:MAG TPA: hypothetical protein VFQ42_04070 [Mycobacterium sp.]|nr:hypothetical protein [Mycobacterium sp.]